MSIQDHLNQVARVEKHRDDHLDVATGLLSSASRPMSYMTGSTSAGPAPDPTIALAAVAQAHATLALVFQGQLDVLDRQWARIEAGV